MNKKTKLNSNFYKLGKNVIHSQESIELEDKKQPIILVHGLLSGRYMTPVGESLAANYNVFNLDFPGFGESYKPKETHTLDQHAQTLAQFIDFLRLDRPILLGNSYGSQIITHFASTYSDKISKIILTGPTVDKNARNIFLQSLALLRDLKYMPNWQISMAWQTEYSKVGIGRLLKTVQDCLNDKPEDYFPKVTVPTLVVRGSNDPFVSRLWVEEIVKLLPLGSLVEIPGKGHTINSNAPEELAQIVNKFINE